MDKWYPSLHRAQTNTITIDCSLDAGMWGWEKNWNFFGLKIGQSGGEIQVKERNLPIAKIVIDIILHFDL